jgi:protein-S-isoprenylcysteine O-methyltransferase Ste14
MNATTSGTDTSEATEKTFPAWQAFVRVTVFVLIMGALLFIPAGRLDWLMAWVYLVVYVANSTFGLVFMLSKHPDLISERAEAPGDAKDWDKALSTILIVLTLLVPLLIAGLDVRFGWSPPLSLGLQLGALVLYEFGFAVGFWAGITNKFDSRVVRIQKDRGHLTVTDGPYRYVRHPGYVGAIVNMVTLPLILGSVWALVNSGLAVVLLIVRTALEDRTLQEELPGYIEYTQQTRYRLLPGIW